MNRKLCGDFGGRKSDGSPCQRRAGEGTDNDSGRCWQHLDQKTDTDKRWECPDEYSDDPVIQNTWEMIADFCKNYKLTSSPFYLLANNVVENHYIKRKCFKVMKREGVVSQDKDHGDRSKKKHPASTTYFKAHNAMKSSLKELIKKAKNKNPDEDIEDSPVGDFFDKWS